MLLLAATLYLIFILALMVRGFRSSSVNISPKKAPNGISVVIPFRNEAHNLKQLITSLARQSIHIPYEIILVNDGSTDDFQEILDSEISLYPHLSCRVVNNFIGKVCLTSKQNAIDTGVMTSKYEMIVFTDADMSFSPLWLQSLVDHFDVEKSPFVFGRTSIISTSSLLAKIQSMQLDFLFATAHIFIRSGLDSSCMGNNIAISRTLYDQIGGQKGLGYSIVEDKKLLTAVKKFKVIPIPVEPFYSHAFTYAVDSPKVYLHQMIRWLRGGASESKQILAIVFLLGFEGVAMLFTLTYNANTLLSITAIAGGILTWLLYILEFKRIIPIHRGVFIPLFFILFLVESLILLPALFFVSPKWKGISILPKGKEKC